jgi:3-oxoacyl-[acyl-carrier-protein] synthase-3
MADLPNIGVSSVEYVLGSNTLSVEQLETRGLLVSPAARLRAFGFSDAKLSPDPPYELAVKATEKLLEATKIDPLSLDALFYVGATPDSHAISSPEAMSAFNYPVAQLQYTLGMSRAVTFGVSQLGCAGLMRAVSSARDYLLSRPEASRVVCVSSDVLSEGCQREMIYNVISDGACALLVEKSEQPRNRILAYRQITKGYYWDSIARKNEIVAAYFPTARTAIQETLASVQTELSEIAWILPHNVSARSWEILLGLLATGSERLFADNIPKIAHVIAADNWINLKDATSLGRVRPGDRLLLFTFGFGANWACMLLEH